MKIKEIFIIISFPLIFNNLIKSELLMYSENLISKTIVKDSYSDILIEIQEYIDINKDNLSSILIKFEKIRFHKYNIDIQNTLINNKKEKLWKFEFFSKTNDYKEITYFNNLFSCIVFDIHNPYYKFSNLKYHFKLYSVIIFNKVDKKLGSLTNSKNSLFNIEKDINKSNLYLCFSSHLTNDTINSRILINHPSKYFLIEKYLLDGFYFFKNQIEIADSLNADYLYKGKSNIIMNLLEEDNNFEDNIFSIYINNIQSTINSDLARKEEIDFNRHILYFTSNLFQSLYLFSFYKNKNIELKNSFKDVLIEYIKNSEFSKIETKDEYYVSPIAIFRGVGKDLIMKTDIINNENIFLQIRKTFDSVIFKNSKFLSTSLDLNIAANYAQYKNCSNLLKFVGNKDCHIPVLCFECRNESVNNEREVLLHPNIFFKLNNISVQTVNNEDYIILEMISVCKEYSDMDIIELF